ncbi:MAG: ABC transporter ATP-binding protein [Bacteroidales bacterium]|jgi:ABC-2 type transport system ATP-binding protein|nr:ABC transporter ATP-binding protein [Bacteroidales bacterium]
MVNIENLSFNYSRQIVFKDINLNLEAGKIYGLLGQNGVGKTTLLKLIGGFLKVKSGKCTVMGFTPFDRDPAFYENIILIPEDFIAPDMIVNQYASLRGEFYPGYDANKFSRLMTEFDVNGNFKFSKLSYGQQKKALIAFSLATNTKLILMDEPSNGLDIPSKSQLRKVISEASTDESCIVISTHQVRDLENLIDPIIILDRDGVLLNETIERISQKLSFVFRGSSSEESLHCESTPGGYLVVKENETSEESKVNIEALFNTTLNNKQTIKNLFSK